MLSLADIVIAVIVVVSAGLGLGRGLIREVLSLIAWVGAILVTIYYADTATAALAQYINEEPMRRMVAIALLFLPTLLILSVISSLLARFLLRHHADSHDQLLGLLFGALRGVVIVAIAVLVGRATALTHEQWWHESTLIPRVEALIAQVSPYLPDPVAQFLAASKRPTATRRLVLYPNPNGQYLAKGFVNGEGVEFLLDTGASLVMLSQPLAKRLNLRPGKPLEVITAIGETTTYEVTLRSIRIGAIEIRNVRAAINPRAADDHALLGASFLRRVNFQQSGNSLILEQTQFVESYSED